MGRRKIGFFCGLCGLFLSGLAVSAVEIDEEEITRRQMKRESALQELQRTIESYSFSYMVIHVPPGMIPGVDTSVPVTHIRYDSQLFFSFDRHSLEPDSLSIISDFATFVKADETLRSILVVGHTDAVGTDDYNQGLSLRRAAAVSARLRELGVDEAVLGVVPMGEAQPIATNSTEMGRSRNRRVEFFISDIKEATPPAIELLGFDPCFRRDDEQAPTPDVPCEAAVQRIPVYVETGVEAAPSSFLNVRPNVRPPLPNEVLRRPRLPVH